MDIYFRLRMKPEPRLRKSPTQIDPYAEPSKHIVMFEKKAKSDQKLEKSKKRMSERKKVLRAEAAKIKQRLTKKAREKRRLRGKGSGERR